jgi:hypothetical protein
MKRMNRRLLGLVGAVVIAVAACGGGGPSTADPAGAVTAALDAAESGGLTKLTEFACAAQKDKIAEAFGGQSLAGLEAAGISAEELFGSMQMSFDNVKATETSRSGDKATVHVTGDMKIAFDKTKFKEILKAMMQQAGQSVDDATLELAMGAMESQLTQTQKLDEDMTVVQEGGKWLICE